MPYKCEPLSYTSLVIKKTNRLLSWLILTIDITKSKDRKAKTEIYRPTSLMKFLKSFKYKTLNKKENNNIFKLYLR